MIVGRASGGVGGDKRGLEAKGGRWGGERGGKGGLDAIFLVKGGDGRWRWMMEIERSQHASTTQRGQRQGKNRTGGSETGYK